MYTGGFKILDIEMLCKYHGKDITLGELLERFKGDRKHKCPKCKGTGKLQTINPFWESPNPGLDYSSKGKYEFFECDLCEGKGYTEHEYKPKMKYVQDGWEQL